MLNCAVCTEFNLKDKIINDKRDKTRESNISVASNIIVIRSYSSPRVKDAETNFSKMESVHPDEKLNETFDDRIQVCFVQCWLFIKIIIYISILHTHPLIYIIYIIIL